MEDRKIIGKVNEKVGLTFEKELKMPQIRSEQMVAGHVYRCVGEGRDKWGLYHTTGINQDDLILAIKAPGGPAFKGDVVLLNLNNLTIYTTGADFFYVEEPSVSAITIATNKD